MCLWERIQSVSLPGGKVTGEDKRHFRWEDVEDARSLRRRNPPKSDYPAGGHEWRRGKRNSTSCTPKSSAVFLSSPARHAWQHLRVRPHRGSSESGFNSTSCHPGKGGGGVLWRERAKGEREYGDPFICNISKQFLKNFKNKRLPLTSRLHFPLLEKLLLFWK